MTDVLPSPEEKIARARGLLRLVSIALACLLVVVMAIGVVVVVRLSDLSSLAQRNACSDRLIADGFAAAGHALAAPPAPNLARDAAVADIIRASERLSHSDQVCASGTPVP